PAALAAQRTADPTLDHDNPLEEVFEDQLSAADLVVLNKTDLLAAEALDAVERDLGRQKRAATKLIGASHGAVAPALLLGLDAAAEDDLASRPSHHDLAAEHDHDAFDSLGVAGGPGADTPGFLGRLGEIIAAHDILRLKGFLHVPGRDFRQVVQGVGARLQHYFDRPWGAAEMRQSRLVVIGRKGLDRAAIAAAIEA